MGRDGHLAVVQPELAILVLLYEQAPRIYSLAAATERSRSGTPVNADSADRRHGDRSSPMADILWIAGVSTIQNDRRQSGLTKHV